MVIEWAKMGSGLITRSVSAGLFLRLAAFAAMLLAAWKIVIQWVGPQLHEIAKEQHAEPLLVILAAVPVIAALGALITGSEPPCRWGLSDFARRIPFVCWCLMTDDGDDIPLWAILVWPVLAIVEIPLCIMVLLAIPIMGLVRGLFWIADQCGRILTMRPFRRK